MQIIAGMVNFAYQAVCLPGPTGLSNSASPGYPKWQGV